MQKVIQLGIEGVGTGLLMNSPAGMGGNGSRSPARMGKNIPSPEEEAKSKLYVLHGSNQLCALTDWFREASLIASKSFRDKTRKGNASYLQRFGASVFMTEPEVPLWRNDDKPITDDPDDYELYIKRVVVQGNGIMRARPLIRNLSEEHGGPWYCVAEFEFDADTISPPGIAMIVHQAGKFPGVADYRPGKGGPFGRYRIESINGEEYEDTEDEDTEDEDTEEEEVSE
jgi:hypothetical protein